MVLGDLVRQEKLDESLRKGVSLSGARRSLQNAYMREWDGQILLQDCMCHGFQLEERPRSCPLSEAGKAEPTKL